MIAKPIVRWIGGKRQMLPFLMSIMPKEYNAFYEPFLGGAAFTLALAPQKGVAGDTNKRLIDCYKQVIKDPEDTVRHLHNIRSLWDRSSEEKRKQMFLSVRTAISEGDLDGDPAYAANFIYMLCAAFGGMYRVDKKNRLNVPPGSVKDKTLFLPKPKRIFAFADAMKNVDLGCRSFEETLSSAGKGDLVFLDPPYDGTYNMYDKVRFEDSLQIKLAKEVKELTEKGCFVILTNSNSEMIQDLYKDFYITPHTVWRATERKNMEEAVITNYKPEIREENFEE